MVVVDEDAWLLLTELYLPLSPSLGASLPSLTLSDACSLSEQHKRLQHPQI